MVPFGGAFSLSCSLFLLLLLFSFFMVLLWANWYVLSESFSMFHSVVLAISSALFPCLSSSILFLIMFSCKLLINNFVDGLSKDSLSYSSTLWVHWIFTVSNFFQTLSPSPSSYILLFYLGGTLFSKFSGQWGTCITSHGYLVLLTSLSFILNVGGWKTRWMLLLTELENHAYFWLIRCKLLLVSFEEAVESLLPPRFPCFLYLLFDLTIK